MRHFRKILCALLVACFALSGTGVTASAASSSETQAMYRLYNPNSGEHFYTASANERDKLVSCGWNYEGIGWFAPVSSDTPVYRLYNPNSGDHHYTCSASERDYLAEVGWAYEGIGWYSDDSERVPIYRQYNPNAKSGSHNYSSSSKERDQLVSVGWQDEGIGWYAADGGKADTLAAKSSASLPLPSSDSYSTPSEFIAVIAPYVQKMRDKYGYGVPSAIIAQACLESGFGRSAKAAYHNYFGMMYSTKRVTCSSGYITSASSSTKWFQFANMEKGVEGYFQFIGAPHYANLKSCTTPEQYLECIVQDGYCTASTYVAENMSIVNRYDLTKYD